MALPSTVVPAAVRGATPVWVKSGALLYFDFVSNVAWYNGIAVPEALLTTTRASVGYVEDSAGNWRSVGANIPRISDKGLLVESARTNVVLWNRDFTNAAWSKNNITAAKDQIGVDGLANSASSLLATSANGVAQQ